MVTQRWAEGGQRLQQLGGFDAAIEAYGQALENPTEQYPEWRLQFFIAAAHSANGDSERAKQAAAEALATAPADAASQIEEFIATLN